MRWWTAVTLQVLLGLLFLFSAYSKLSGGAEEIRLGLGIPAWFWAVTAAVEVVGSYAIGTAWKEVLYLLLFIAILVIRPAGLFGQRGAEILGT